MKKSMMVVVTLLACFASHTALAQLGPSSFGPAKINGSGCPTGSVEVVPSHDGKRVSVLFSAFDVETEPNQTIDVSTCSVALPISIPRGITLGLIGVDYQGYAYVPDVPRTSMTGRMSRSYFFAGYPGPRFTEYFPEGTDEFFNIEDDLAVLAYSACGDTSAIARSNVTLMVRKSRQSTSEEAFISLFSEDWEWEVIFHFDWHYC